MKRITLLLSTGLLFNPVLSVQNSFAAEQSVSIDKSSSLQSANLNQRLNNVVNEKMPVAKTVASTQTAAEIVADLNAQFIQKSGLDQSTDGVEVFSAVAPIQRNSSSSEWGMARQLAFEQAFLDAKAEFILSFAGRTIAKTISNIEQDNSSDAHKFDDSQLPLSDSLSGYYKKYMALTNAKLDEKLKDQGIDPSTLTRDPEQRKRLAFNQLLTKTVTQGFGDLAGVMPVKTFIVEHNGEQAIGVVAIYSPKIKALVLDLRAGNLPALSGDGGQAVETFVNKSAQSLSNDFGIRLVFDAQGKPVILSYGQAGYNSNNQNAVISAGQVAQNQAEQFARANFSSFINGTLNIKDSSEMGQEISQELVKNLATGQSSQQNKNSIINRLKNQMTQFSNASLEGVKTIKKWRFDVANSNAKLTGVVLAWTQNQYKNAENVKNDNTELLTSASTGMQNDVTNVSQSDDNPYLHQF
ncbi:MAG: DUF6844 domain-containing protein [Francisellaceae bacterium]